MSYQVSAAHGNIVFAGLEGENIQQESTSSALKKGCLKDMSRSGSDEIKRVADQQNVELGVFVECVGFRYLFARYEIQEIICDLGILASEAGVDGLKSKELENMTGYLLRYVPENCTDISIIGDKSNEINQKPTSIADFDLYTMLLVKVNGKSLYQKFQFSQLGEELMCPVGKEKDIRLQVKLLREKQAILPAAKFKELQNDVQKKKYLWTSDFVSRDVVLSYVLKGPTKQGFFEKNDLRAQIPKPGLKEEFDLRDASEKVITLLSRLTMSNVWSACSPNIYGSAMRIYFNFAQFFCF